MNLEEALKLKQGDTVNANTEIKSKVRITKDKSYTLIENPITIYSNGKEYFRVQRGPLWKPVYAMFEITDDNDSRVRVRDNCFHSSKE